jgi:hypothetical protein
MATGEEVPGFAKCYIAEIEAKVKESIRVGQVKDAEIKILRKNLKILKKYQREAEEAIGVYGESREASDDGRRDQGEEGF